MRLYQTQKLFKRNILDVQQDPQALRELKPVGRLSLDQAFQIYHRIYTSKFTEILMETFPAVRWVLGKDLFNTVCAKFIEAQPLATYILHDYGSNFPEFIKDNRNVRGIPFLYDLARFEWSYKEVLDMPSPSPLPQKTVRELLHTEDFKIQFIEAMNIFESPYAVYNIWEERNSKSYAFEDINWNHPQSLLIYKFQKNIIINRIDAIEAEVLKELQAGSSVDSALADFSTLLTPDKIAQIYQLIAQSGIVGDVIVLET